LSFRRSSRPGITLLEVIIALMIFLFSLVAILRLVGMGNERARDIFDNEQAMQRAQSKLAEVVAGAQPLQSQAETEFTELPGWFWAIDVSDSDVDSVKNVKVRISNTTPSGQRRELLQLSQLVLNPTVRGTTVEGITSTEESTDSTSGTTSGTSGTTTTSGTSSGTTK
jgi:type II secretion system protein I